MGREILYCGGCGVRLLGSDFEQGRATHHSNRSYCASCREVPAPPVAAPEASSKRSSTRVRRVSTKSSAPLPQAPPRSKGKWKPVFALGGAAAAGWIAVALLGSGAPAPAIDALPDVRPLAHAALFPPFRTPPARPSTSEPEFDRRLEAVRTLLASGKAIEHGESVTRDLAAARALASIVPPARLSDLQALESDYRSRCEAAAEALHDELTEAGTVLADEGRIDHALAKIETFPKGLRHTKAWSSLDGFRRQIELRRRTQATR